MKINNNGIGYIKNNDSSVKKDLDKINEKIDNIETKADDLVSEEVNPLSQKVNDLESSKVDKVEGKDLVSNDYTNAEKDKLSSLKNTVVVDNLTTTDSNKAVSANQGRILNQSLNSLNDTVATKIEADEVNELLEQVGLMKYNADVNETEVKEARGVYSSLKERHEVTDVKIKNVEKKNRVQDIYMAGLLNENEDERITIEEEGSDIELTNSKKGLVDVDKIVGSTMTNHLIGKANENLNPSINKNGVDITLNDTVENGVVDVELEGNTLVNLWEIDKIMPSGDVTVGSTNIQITTTTNRFNNFVMSNKTLFKPNTTYTICVYIEKNTLSGDMYITSYAGKSDYDVFNGNNTIKGGVTGLVKICDTTIDDLSQAKYGIRSFFDNVDGKVGEYAKLNIVILEGDWTDKEVPMEYFEGMKSVGEKKEGNSIDIVCHKGRANELKDSYEVLKSKDREYTCIRITDIAKKYLNKKVVVSGKIKSEGKDGELRIYTLGKYYCNLSKSYKCNTSTYIPFECEGVFSYNPSIPNGEVCDLSFYGTYGTGVYPCVKDIKIEVLEEDEEVVSTEWCPNINDDKEIWESFSNGIRLTIPLTEPLRGLPNGVRDKIVKVNGEWFVERNCGVRIIEVADLDTRFMETNPLGMYLNVDSYEHLHKIDTPSISDKLICEQISAVHLPSTLAFSTLLGGEHQWRLYNPSFTTKEEFVTWLTDNPLKVVYQRAEPIYEPLDIPLEMSTYLDVTHIGNDSIIPCNINVKNKGYKTSGVSIAKNYTVVANNVESINYTLDSLDNVRFSGKGTSSNVRMIEGILSEKLIPSVLVGTKSTFESEIVTQTMVNEKKEKGANLGKYKVNVTVKNENGFNETNAVYLSSPLKEGDELVYKEDGLYHYHVYEEDEPYYEKVSDDKLVVELESNATLNIKTIIPCKSTKVTYSTNIPSVRKMKVDTDTNTEEIEETQMAVDFILMDSLPPEVGTMSIKGSTRNVKGGDSMGAYFASRIMKGHLEYSAVVKRYPRFKEDIDFILQCEGREDLIVEG